MMSNRNVIELLLQLKSAKAHGENCIRVKAHLVRHLLRNSLLSISFQFLFKSITASWQGWSFHFSQSFHLIHFQPNLLSGYTEMK